MSNFIVPEVKRKQNVQAASKKNPDALEGLRTAVQNNQVAIALHYLVDILDILDDMLGKEKKAPVKKSVAGSPKADE